MTELPPAEIAHKDVMIAMIGASAALAGLTLVFLGLAINGYQSYPADTTEKVKANARRPAWLILKVFVLGIVTTALAALWLAIPGGNCFYWICVVVFLADLLAIVAVAAKSTSDLLA